MFQRLGFHLIVSLDNPNIASGFDLRDESGVSAFNTLLAIFQNIPDSQIRTAIRDAVRAMGGNGVLIEQSR